MEQSSTPSTNCIIRLAYDSDIRRIVELDYEAFAWSNTAEDENVFRSRLRVFPRGCLIAEVDRQVVGYCTSEKWLQEREPIIGEDPVTTHHADGRVFCVTGFAISKAYQRRGLGTALLTELIGVAKAEQCYCVVLETGDAKTFYARFGFEKVGIRSQNGADMSIVRLNL